MSKLTKKVVNGKVQYSYIAAQNQRFKVLQVEVRTK